jgi:putative flippase GtrA
VLGIVVPVAVILWLWIRGLGALVQLVGFFIHSTLPWWIRVPAAIAVAAGLIYLFLENRRKRMPPNQKFVD